MIGLGQISEAKKIKIKNKTSYYSKNINSGSSIFLGEFGTQRRPFDKSNLSTHISQYLIASDFNIVSSENEADYSVSAKYVTDAIAKKQILGLWLTMVNKEGETILSWTFERKVGGIILYPKEIGEFLSILVNENSVSNTEKSTFKNDNSQQKAIDELKSLKELLDLGLITKEEFEIKSKQLKKIILQ